VIAEGIAILFALAGSLLGSSSMVSVRSESNIQTGQPVSPLFPLGAIQMLSSNGSTGATTSWGNADSTEGPAKFTLPLVPRFIAIGMGEVARGKSPMRNL